ncbi:ankyrin unc44 [Ophiostoma piceae UAMH 11346]|uniref:Ankyrin unc44 n=1 Tax=Ophiostoma piceae (strain UAMH 11346) TaxID=1262450 RepID=S3C3X9_OPHP1|nr:ankyrin unc44 [Ophiostoma piceae UAMH 11346]
MGSKPKTFSLSLLSEGATLRTDVATSLGEAPGNDFTVDFQLLYEVHGALDPGDEDNASLLVVRMIPLPRKPDVQFGTLNVQLSVDLVSGAGGAATDDDADMANVVSFEPAAEGAQFVDVYTTNEERTGSLKASATVPIAQAASLGLEASHGTKSSFTRTHLLRVKANAVRTNPSIPVRSRNGALWRIKAANKEQGIGDSFTVAMLVKRPRGSSFQLVADVSGHIGTFSEKTGKIIDSLIRRKRPPTRLAILPLDRDNARIPPGVLEDDLHRASTENVMRQIDEVGLHLPELARPVTVITGATSSTSIDLAKIFTTSQNEDNADSEAGDEDDGDENPTESEEESVFTAAASLAATSTSTPVPMITPARAVTVAASNTTTTTETSAVTVTDTSAALKPPPASRDSFTHRADSQAPSDPTMAATLTAILQEVKQLRPLADHPNGQQYRSASLLTARRIKRLRETASLYERLAELHREEARELALEGTEVDEYGVAETPV